VIAAPGLKSKWKKRLVERAEKKAVKEIEHEMIESAKKEKQVQPINILNSSHCFNDIIYGFCHFEMVIWLKF